MVELFSPMTLMHIIVYKHDSFGPILLLKCYLNIMCMRVHVCVRSNVYATVCRHALMMTGHSSGAV